MILLLARFGTTSFTLADSQCTWSPHLQACTAMSFLLSHFFTATLCLVSPSCFIDVHSDMIALSTGYFVNNSLIV